MGVDGKGNNKDNFFKKFILPNIKEHHLIPLLQIFVKKLLNLKEIWIMLENQL